MDDRKVGELWEENAPAWIQMSRAGYDVYRDYINTPAFLKMLPAVDGLKGLDVGCGEGHNTRQVASLGAKMTGIDIAPTFIEAARAKERQEPLGIEYRTASAAQLPFESGSFDFVTGFMSFMDIADHDQLISEIRRVLRPGGFLQFSITHPCFQTPRWKWVIDVDGKRVAVECGDYFRPQDGAIDEWTFSAAPPQVQNEWPQFKVPRFGRTLSGWFDLLRGHDFRVDALGEPSADDEALKTHPALADTRVVAYFLHVRCIRD